MNEVPFTLKLKVSSLSPVQFEPVEWKLFDQWIAEAAADLAKCDEPLIVDVKSAG